MKLFVGLGNPGAKYSQNRHNIGFMAVDRIAEDHGFSPWKSKFQGQLCEGRLGHEKVLLLKPSTFMNLSGQSVGEAMRFYKLDSTDVTGWRARGAHRSALHPSAHQPSVRPRAPWRRPPRP